MNLVTDLMGSVGPEYLKKRVLQEVVEDTENTDTVMHEPLLAEEEPLLADEEPLPTPPESPLPNELDGLMPGSSPGRTPSPSPAIPSKEDPKLLGPRSWNEDKSSKAGTIKAASKPSSRPTTPSTLAAASSLATPEGGGAPSSHGPSRSASRQSNKNEQGSDLEIKPLQKLDSEVKAPVFVPAPAAPVRNSLIAADEEAAPHHASHVTPKDVPSEPKAAEAKPEAVLSAQEPTPSTSEKKKQSREGSRPSSRAETRPVPKRQPSPAPPPKPAPSQEPKTVPKQAETKAIAAKPALKILVSSKETSTEPSELEVKYKIHITSQ